MRIRKIFVAFKGIGAEPGDEPNFEVAVPYDDTVQVSINKSGQCVSIVNRYGIRTEIVCETIEQTEDLYNHISNGTEYSKNFGNVIGVITSHVPEK